jgi:hypothetical protein
MTDPEAAYAIAILMARGYMKAMRTFRGPLAFERLGLVLCLVGRNGDVRELSAHEVPAWIELPPG